MRYTIFVLFLISLTVFAYVGVEGDYVKVVFKPSYYDGEVEEVYLFGTFFDYVEMEYENGKWVTLLELENGIYDYVFLVNGEDEVVDPEAPERKTIDGEDRGVFAVVKTPSGLKIVKPSEYEVSMYDGLEFGVGIYKGRVYFKLKDNGYDEAYVAGDFTGWEKDPLKMKKFGDFWIAFADLEEGEHQYKYIVIKDGKRIWLKPPNAPKYVDDGFGGKNGYFVIEMENGNLVLKEEKEETVVAISKTSQEKSEFSEEFLKGLPDGLSVHDGYVFFKVKDIGAERAYLAGTFNNWDPHGIEMKKLNDRWIIWLKLDPGEYQYKFVFVVNGQDVWKEDPNAPGYVPDGFGGKNGIFKLVLKNGKLEIEKPEVKKAEGILKGILEFEYTLQQTEDGFVPTDNPTKFSLELIYNPSDAFMVSVGYDGAYIKSAKVELKNGDFVFKALKGECAINESCLQVDSISLGYAWFDFGIGFSAGVGFYAGVNFDVIKAYLSRDFIDRGDSLKVSFDTPLGLGFDGFYNFTSSSWNVDLSYRHGDLTISGYYSSDNSYGIDGGYGDFRIFYENDAGDTLYGLEVPTFIIDDLKLGYSFEDSSLVDTISYRFILESENYEIEFDYVLKDMGFTQRFFVLKGKVKF